VEELYFHVGLYKFRVNSHLSGLLSQVQNTWSNSTQLFSTGIWVESDRNGVQSGSGTLNTYVYKNWNQQKIIQLFCQSLSSEHFQNSCDWVESDRALWTRQKPKTTSCDPVFLLLTSTSWFAWKFPARPESVYQHQNMAATARRRKALALIGIYFLLKRRHNRQQWHYCTQLWLTLHDEQGVYNNLVRKLQLEGK